MSRCTDDTLAHGGKRFLGLATRKREEDVPPVVELQVRPPLFIVTSGCDTKVEQS